jgi:hypothetical protein
VCSAIHGSFPHLFGYGGENFRVFEDFYVFAGFELFMRVNLDNHSTEDFQM